MKIRARRRISWRSALFLTALSCAVLLSCAALRAMSAVIIRELMAPLGFDHPAVWVARATAAVTALASVVLSALGTVMAFGFPAYAGLCVLDGDHAGELRTHALSHAHVFWLSLLGVLAVAPASLAGDIAAAVPPLFGFAAEAAAQQAAPEMFLFLPMLLGSALLAPVCEELFFRGYIFSAVRRRGDAAAALMSAALFALMHGVNIGMIPRFLLGLLLALVMIRSGSIFAPVIVHSFYNLTILVLSFAGFDGLISGTGLFSAAFRLALCAAFVYVLRRAYALRMVRAAAVPPGAALLKQERMALISAALVLIAALIMGVGVCMLP